MNPEGGGCLIANKRHRGDRDFCSWRGRDRGDRDGESFKHRFERNRGDRDGESLNTEALRHRETQSFCILGGRERKEFLPTFHPILNT